MSAVSNKAISDYLSEYGICHSSQAYKFLMLGIRAILDGTADRYCVKTVYECIAQQAGVTTGQVDSAIRLAIRKTANPIKNKEFLIRAADELAFTADANAFLFEDVSPGPSG